MTSMIEPTVSVSSTAPDFLTLEEAAAVLRVGRSTAYREANAFEASGGTTGIPVARYGRQFRVPRYWLEERLGGPLTWPPPIAIEPEIAQQSRLTERAKRTVSSRSTAQLSLAIES